jgi:hypothetical protein
VPNPINIKNAIPSIYSGWGRIPLKQATAKLRSLGGKTAKLTGLTDLKIGFSELHKGNYSAARKSLAEGSIRFGVTLAVTVAASYGIYKTVSFIQTYFQQPSKEPTSNSQVNQDQKRLSQQPSPPIKQQNQELESVDPEREPDPSQQVTDVGDCNERRLLEKWQVHCNEYHQDPALKSFINSNNIYPAKVAAHSKNSGLNRDAFDLKRNYKGDLLIPTNNGYELWDQLKKNLTCPGLVATADGYAPFGTPFSVKPTEGYQGEEPQYFLDVKTWSWEGSNPHPHNGINIREVGEKTTIHSFGFYPEGQGKDLMWESLVSNIRGEIKSPEPLEFKGGPFKQTTINITKDQYEKLKGMMFEDHGEYGMANIISTNCTGFVQKALEIIGKKVTCNPVCIPANLGNQLAREFGTNQHPTRLV